jgi:hypothetical protein
MTGISVCMAALLLGVDAGWRPLPDGGMEYTIQVSPGTWDSMRAGVAIESDVPPEVRGTVRTYRVVVGSDRLVRKLPDAPAPVLAERHAPPRSHQVAKPPEAAAAPATLPAGPAGKSLAEQRAAFQQATGTVAKPAQEPAAASKNTATTAEPSRPWLLFLLFLFASLGANLYLGWITWDVRERYRRLLGRAAEPA